MSDGPRDAEAAARMNYGSCPTCGAPGRDRERRINGYTTCVQGHRMLSSYWDAAQDKHPTQPLPTLGRIVRIVWPDGVTSPAIVTRTARDTNYDLGTQAEIFHNIPQDRWGNKPVPEDVMDATAVDVQVFGLVRCYPLYNVPFSDSILTRGHWHWPER